MNPTQYFTYTTQMTSPTVNLLLPTIHGTMNTRLLGTEQQYSQLQDTRHNWTSQNTQPLKQETLHSTVQTVPEATIKCIGGEIALLAVSRTYSHYKPFPAHICTTSSFSHFFAQFGAFRTILHNCAGG